MKRLSDRGSSFQYYNLTNGYHVIHLSEVLPDEVLNHPEMLIFDDQDKFEEYIDNNDNWKDFSFNETVSKGYVLFKNMRTFFMYLL